MRIRSRRGSRWVGLGLPDGFVLESGVAVMVPVGLANAQVNAMPPVIAYATVTHLASPADGDDEELWWLDVHMTASGEALPQMYRRSEILGLPAHGLKPTVTDAGS